MYVRVPPLTVSNFSFSYYNIKIDWLIDHVDRVRLRLWTPTTNGSIICPPVDNTRLENYGGMISSQESS
jgi:hypothetical protein